MLIIWWFIFITSLASLTILAFRDKAAANLLVKAGIQLLLAAALLYAVNRMDPLSPYSIPVNGVTLATVGILGMPGFVLLLAVKLFFVL